MLQPLIEQNMYKLIHKILASYERYIWKLCAVCINKTLSATENEVYTSCKLNRTEYLNVTVYGYKFERSHPPLKRRKGVHCPRKIL